MVGVAEVAGMAGIGTVAGKEAGIAELWTGLSKGVGGGMGGDTIIFGWFSVFGG